MHVCLSPGAPVQILEASTAQEQTAFVVAAACVAAGVDPAAAGPPRRCLRGPPVLACSAGEPPAPPVGAVDRRPQAAGPSEGAPAPSVAILYRQRKSGRAFQALLRGCGVPFNRCATPPLLTRAVRDAAAALLLLAVREGTGALPAGLERRLGCEPELTAGDARHGGGWDPVVGVSAVAGGPSFGDASGVVPTEAGRNVGRQLEREALKAAPDAVEVTYTTAQPAQPACTGKERDAQEGGCRGGSNVPWKRGQEPAWLRLVAGRRGVPHALAAAALRLFRVFLEEEACMKRTGAGIGSEVRLQSGQHGRVSHLTLHMNICAALHARDCASS